ncbi:transposable element Tcb1 transposase [Trichonephila clavipes]|nr:transposable element Tcb1 transposase [Trichonephila clavipes]
MHIRNMVCAQQTKIPCVDTTEQLQPVKCINTLPLEVLDCTKGVYRESSSPNFLAKCLHGKTQNYNESVNRIIGEIGSRVGRNQTTVMWICDRWMQEGTTDRRGRSHPPQCTTSREDRHIVRMAVADRSVTSRSIAQHIESVTLHSVSARTIRRRLQESGLPARRSLLSLPLTQNHRRLRRQWCDERRMWAAEWNEVVLTDE